MDAYRRELSEPPRRFEGGPIGLIDGHIRAPAPGMHCPVVNVGLQVLELVWALCPVLGWGARMLGEDREWRYVPVRRLALFLKETVYRGNQWVLFEPNGKSLWAQIRRSVAAVMTNLWRQGALQGTRADEAFLVRRDATTGGPSGGPFVRVVPEE